jgi:hypothetical protein
MITERENKEITIDELADLIESQIWEFGIEEFTYEECFNSKKKTLIIEDLHIDVEDDFIIFYDIKDVLINNCTNMRLKSTLQHIYYSFVKGVFIEEVCFISGHITIIANSSYAA